MRKLPTGIPVARIVAVALISFVLLGSQAAAPQSALAACGTSWTNRQEPPSDIRVLRTDSGKVEKVGFKRYVAVVMASGEWPTTLSRPVLEAGAQAVKQYGWYYALKGNHRSGYKSASGKCYDVRDDGKDQVYRPETAEPTEKQKKARDALWGLSLRKKDEFLLTGYRAGSEDECGADADGWHLYAKSSKDCVKSLDYDSEDILRAYYEPKLDLVWAPGTEPDVVESDSQDPEAKPDEAAASGASDAAAGDQEAGLFGGMFGWIDDVLSSIEAGVAAE